MGGTRRIEERFAYAGGRVDRTGPRPVIRDVLLCGATSANRRRYLREAFAGERVKAYEGRPVFLNHAGAGEARRYESRIAKVVNPRLRADGLPVGDLEVRPKHPYAEAFLDDAEHDPGSVGMSHVAHCRTRPGPDGWDDVTAVESVESVDVVLDPATTKGMFEGKRVATTLRAVIEQFRAKLQGERLKEARKLLLLSEDDAALGGMMDAPVEAPAADADPDQAIDDAFKQAMHAQVDALLNDSHTLAEFLSKCRELFKSRAKIMGKPAPAEGDGGGTGGTSGGSEEGKKPAAGTALLEALDACTKGGLAATREDLELVAAAPADRRPALVERLKLAVKATEGGPTSAGRGRIAPEPPAAAKATEGAPPSDGKAFAEWVK